MQPNPILERRSKNKETVEKESKHEHKVRERILRHCGRQCY
jgi:hypothetical protein